MRASADAIVESFRPGVVAGLGVDYASIAAVNPRIVYASISGYGQHGPRAQAAGHDINYLGYAGVLDQTGVRDGPPALCNLQIADLLGAARRPPRSRSSRRSSAHSAQVGGGTSTSRWRMLRSRTTSSRCTRSRNGGERFRAARIF